MRVRHSDSLTGDLMKWGEIPQRKGKNMEDCAEHTEIKPIPPSQPSLRVLGSQILCCSPNVHILPDPSSQPILPSKMAPEADTSQQMAPCLGLLGISLSSCDTPLDLYFLFVDEGTCVYVNMWPRVICMLLPSAYRFTFWWALIQARDARDRNFKHRSQSKGRSTFGQVGLWFLLHSTVLVALSFISGQGFWQGADCYSCQFMETRAAKRSQVNITSFLKGNFDNWFLPKQ